MWDWRPLLKQLEIRNELLAALTRVRTRPAAPPKRRWPFRTPKERERDEQTAAQKASD